jgi:hypothetical protein
MTREEKLEQFAIDILESQWAMGEKDAMDLIVKSEELELFDLAKEFRKLLAEPDPKDDLKHDLYNALNPNNL